MAKHARKASPASRKHKIRVGSKRYGCAGYKRKAFGRREKVTIVTCAVIKKHKAKR